MALFQMGVRLYSYYTGFSYMTESLLPELLTVGGILCKKMELHLIFFCFETYPQDIHQRIIYNNEP